MAGSVMPSMVQAVANLCWNSTVVSWLARFRTSSSVLAVMMNERRSVSCTDD